MTFDRHFARGILAPVLLISGLLTLEACSPPTQQSAPEDKDEKTREVAMEFLSQMFIENDIQGAYDTFAKPNFIQHSPGMANGLEGQRAFFAGLADNTAADADSALAHVSDILLVDGDIFALVHHIIHGPEDSGTIFVDLWRVEDGKIAEHWDVVQNIPADIPHENGMGCGETKTYATAKAHKDSLENPTCGAPDLSIKREESLQNYRDYVGAVGKGDVLAAIEEWFHPDYRQHSPVIADGKQGAITYLSEEWGDPEAPTPLLGEQRIVAQGDYVLIHYMFELEGVPGKEAHIDVFRFKDGQISEHWDMKQSVPEVSANTNDMW